MNYAAALTVRPDFVHDLRAVNRAERFTTEEVLPDIGDGPATWARFRRRSLLCKMEQKNKQTALRATAENFFNSS